MLKKEEDIKITVESIRKCVSGMSNKKAPESDGVQGLWLKRMTNLRNRLAKQLISLFKYWYCTPVNGKGYNSVVNSEGQ